MAQLAIKGHATRGSEVIELLEMLGGENMYQINAHRENYVYFVDEDNIIRLLKINQLRPEQFIVFTLEEFFEKFPYKVGDKVWYKRHKTPCFIRKMFWEKDKVLYELSDEVYSDGCSLPDTLIFDVSIAQLQPYKEEIMEETNNDNWAKWDLPVGYEFQDKEGNVINTDTIKLVKKQSQYPKTYEECCEVLGVSSNNLSHLCLYDTQLIKAFVKLKICRDAYWKIAGEQMSLGKPWKPDWTNPSERKYCIVNTEGNITKWVQKTTNKILAFPTEKMRNIFFENFNDLIEQCKELL